MVPRSGWWAPVMILIRVDFPAPFSPTNACTSPGKSSKETPFNARTAPKDLVMLERQRRGRVIEDEPPPREQKTTSVFRRTNLREKCPLQKSWQRFPLPGERASTHRRKTRLNRSSQGLLLCVRISRSVWSALYSGALDFLPNTICVLNTLKD